MDTKIDKRGGHRPNSGRPKSEEKRKQVCLYLLPEVADKLKQMARERNTKVGRIVEELVYAALPILKAQDVPPDFDAEKWLDNTLTIQKVLLTKGAE